MTRPSQFSLVAVLWVALSFTPAALAQDGIRLGKPLPGAHAHNDYEHPRPLLDALQHGFCGVEADIHLRNGELLVGHDPEDLVPERTIEKLYLQPLNDLVKENGGRVYPGGPSVILLVDIKTEAAPTYAALQSLLEKHRQMLTKFENGKVQTNAVTVILSGSRPRQVLLAQNERLAAFDGRLADLGHEHPVAFMPLVSDNWTSHFTWKGVGALPSAEKMKLDALVSKAHSEGRLIRFWAVPDVPVAWAVLKESGVDLINTDDLPGLARFLQK